MHKRTIIYSVAAGLAGLGAGAQPFDITTFDPAATGPWSEVGRTTLMVPKVANGSIQLDGAASDAEYGGFSPVTVTPGVNAWILNWPEDRVWDGANDSSFQYWLAHDDSYFYVGVKVSDDVVTSDDPNGAFWKDDAIEIVVDALADRFDNNTDNSKDPVGGHCYVNYQGRFSSWDESANAIGNQTWSTSVPWSYGQNGEVFGTGKAVAGGWQMEVRLKKTLFEDATAGNHLRNGYRMGFNIGLDDDDKHGPGLSGDASRTQDLELQYFWANRQRRKGYTAEYLAGLSAEERASKDHLQNLELVIDGDGRLSHAGAGEILFGFDEAAKATGKVLFVSSADVSPINGDPGLIAFLRAKGYTVTVFNSSGSTPDAFREAAAGQDVVLISETIGSTSVVDPAGDGTGVFSLKNTDIPVISFEAYMFDNADWVARTADGSNDFINWGNTSRSEVPEAIQDARDSLYIRLPNHPIAAGFAAGKLPVYNTRYSLNWGVPSADAKVVASAEPDGSYPTIFVYEKGDKLVDGSVAPNKRIGLFIGQAANPAANTPLEFSDLNEAGRTLLLNTVSYAIGTKTPSTPTLALARAGNEVTVTYANGVLQSADAIPGTWKDETGASPLKVGATGSAKFYRVRGN